MDNFDPASSHVIPALIRRFEEAKRAGRPAVTVWGTGRPTREFLFVEDAAEAIHLALERYDGPHPVNVGSGSEISIRELAEMISQLTGFDGRVIWDPTHPDGQPRRCLAVSKAERFFGFRSRTPLKEGLQRTIQWYLENRAD